MAQQQETIDNWVNIYINLNPQIIPQALSQIVVKNNWKGLGPFGNPMPPPEPLQHWVIYETSANSNDCMIHSILTDLSPTFRNLASKDRDNVARAFRNTKFKEIVLEYYQEQINVSLFNNQGEKLTTQESRIEFLNLIINSDEFLRSEFLIPICKFYMFNCVLYYSKSSNSDIRQETALLSFEGDELNSKWPCIVMHNYTQTHFEAMSNENGDFLFPKAEYGNLQQIVNQLREAGGPANPVCRFNDNDTIQGSLLDEYNGWTVINRIFGGPDQPICYQLQLENPEKTEKVTVDINALFPGDYVVEQRPQSSASGLPSFSSLPGRSGIDFENYLEESNEPIILSTNLESIDNQLNPITRETIKKNTDSALEDLKVNAVIKLKKLDFFNWFFGGEIPKDCEKFNTPKVKTTIKKRIKEFESSPRGNLLITLYEGLTGKKFDNAQGDVKMQILALFDSTNESFNEIKELCKLSSIQLILNQAENLKTQAKNLGLLQENGIIDTDNPKWKLLLKNMKLADTIGKADKKAKELIEYLNGSNILSALKKASKYTDEEQKSLLNFKDLPETKWLREFLTTYRLSGFPIQIALDFNSQDIDDAFVKDVTITEEQKEDAEDQNETIVNGKTFVKSMVTNMSLPTNFSISDNQFVGNELNQKLVQSDEGFYYVTQKIPFLKEYAEVILSREITNAVNYFEQFDTNSQNNNAQMNAVSLPLYIIFACQKRKKKSAKEIEELKLEGDDIYKKDENGNFVYVSFHTSILFLCDGKIYTLGYGSDPFLDDEEKKTDPKIKYLKKVEKIVKDNSSFIPGIDLQGVQLLGTGYIYSPDSLNITEDSFNYSIIDIGILKTSHIIRLNKILATIKKIRAISMVVGEGDEPRNVTVEQLSAQTMCVYSRLASRYNQYFPIAAQIMNCSSFIEAVFYDRINCTAQLGYSDPNSCVKKQKPYGSTKEKRIEGILKAYFGDGTLSEFKNLVDYTSDVTAQEGEIASLWTKVAKASLAAACVAGTCLLASNFFGGDAEIKLKKRKKQKRPKNNTAKKLSNKSDSK